jgi:hypothetical protein
VGSGKRAQVGADLIDGKVKKRCCRSRPRCRRCPVVARRLAKAGAHELTGKELKRAVRQARGT